MSRKKDYLKSRTHEDYLWPRKVPLLVKPSLPPTRTGVRIYCPKPDTRICKEDGYEDYGQITHGSNIFLDEQEEDNGILMDRDEYMFLNKVDKNKKINDDLERLKSTFQIDYTMNNLSYEYLMDKAIEPKEGQTMSKRCKISKYYVDPLSFKKTIINTSIIV